MTKTLVGTNFPLDRMIPVRPDAQTAYQLFAATDDARAVGGGKSRYYAISSRRCRKRASPPPPNSMPPRLTESRND